MFESKELKQETLTVRLGIPTVYGGEDVNRHFLEDQPEEQSRNEAAISTYKTLYSGKDSVEDRDRLCKETREKYGGLW